MKKYKHYTEKEFKTIKSLCDLKIPIRTIMKMTERSYSTIRYTQISKNFQAYKKKIKDMFNKRKETGANSLTDTSIGYNKIIWSDDPNKYPMIKNRNQEDMIIEQLSHINKNLERLAQAWEVKPKSFLHKMGLGE